MYRKWSSKFYISSSCCECRSMRLAFANMRYGGKECANKYSIVSRFISKLCDCLTCVNNNADPFGMSVWVCVFPQSHWQFELTFLFCFQLPGHPFWIVCVCVCVGRRSKFMFDVRFDCAMCGTEHVEHHAVRIKKDKCAVCDNIAIATWQFNA